MRKKTPSEKWPFSSHHAKLLRKFKLSNVIAKKKLTSKIDFGHKNANYFWGRAAPLNLVVIAVVFELCNLIVRVWVCVCVRERGYVHSNTLTHRGSARAPGNGVWVERCDCDCVSCSVEGRRSDASERIFF